MIGTIGFRHVGYKTVWLALTALLLQASPCLGRWRLTPDRQANQAEGPHFKLVLEGNGRTGDGTPTYFSTFESERGIKVYKTYIEFSSPQRTDDALRAWLKQATRILQKGRAKGKDGRETIKRILFLVPARDANRSDAILVRVDGVRYVEFRSPSLEDVLELEKQHYDPQDVVQKRERP